jgi:hypothetical protein
MRKRLMLLSALTCVAGGAALPGPATANGQSYPYPPCSEWVGQFCTPRTYFKKCMTDEGYVEVLHCVNGSYQYPCTPPRAHATP